MTHYVDAHVGKRIRRRRWMISMTQKQLANSIGIKFQQVQKYENGTNRVSASRLFQIAKAMDVPVSFFFERIDDTEEKDLPVPGAPVEFFQEKETIQLVKYYYAWPEEQRRHLFDLAKSLSQMTA